MTLTFGCLPTGDEDFRRRFSDLPPSPLKLLPPTPDQLADDHASAVPMIGEDRGSGWVVADEEGLTIEVLYLQDGWTELAQAKHALNAFMRRRCAVRDPLFVASDEEPDLSQGVDVGVGFLHLRYVPFAWASDGTRSVAVFTWAGLAGVLVLDEQFAMRDAGQPAAPRRRARSGQTAARRLHCPPRGSGRHRGRHLARGNRREILKATTRHQPEDSHGRAH
ncbi:MAG: hypothetical protein QOH12_3014 [Solirubrobacteraceae bacterium]|nr:hypothetical protein [Solirubrobacteraceae bacterium]